MKRNLVTLCLVFLLGLAMLWPVAAQPATGFDETYSRVQDGADLLSDDEEEALLERLDELRLRQNMDVAVVTTNETEGLSLSEYADAVYEMSSFGYGEDQDGLLLLICIQEERSWYISTYGYGITVFTDAGIAYIGEQLVPALSKGEYAEAFETFAALCDQFITQAAEEAPYDVGSLPRKPLSLVWIPVSLGIGLLIALVVVGVMKSGLKTVQSQDTADQYVKKNSLKVTDSRDLFLYHTVTRTAKPKETTSSGSSTHQSSSGRTHGGGGGTF